MERGGGDTLTTEALKHPDVDYYWLSAYVAV